MPYNLIFEGIYFTTPGREILLHPQTFPDVILITDITNSVLQHSPRHTKCQEATARADRWGGMDRTPLSSSEQQEISDPCGHPSTCEYLRCILSREKYSESVATGHDHHAHYARGQ